MRGRKRRAGQEVVDNLPMTMMALAKSLQLKTKSAEVQAFVEMIGIAASENPSVTTADFGRSPAATLVATREPTPEEGAASRFVAVVSGFACDTLDLDQALIAMQYAGMLAARFPAFVEAG